MLHLYKNIIATDKKEYKATLFLENRKSSALQQEYH